MSDIKDEETLLTEMFDLYLTDEDLEKHDDDSDFEALERQYWDSEKVIYDRIDLDNDLSIEDVKEDEYEEL